MTWTRATKSFPCAICGKPDWCTYSTNRQGWACMRVDSPRPMKHGGHWHPLGAKPQFVPKSPPVVPEIDAAALMAEFRSDTRTEQVARLATALGVSTDSLTRTGCAWAAAHSAWAFPMVNGQGNTVGIRLRANDGRKWSVTGGREGIFIPQGWNQTAYLPEGPTSLAAALTLGLWGIARPSCRSGVVHLQVAINRLGIKRAVIFADNDPSKWNEKLQRWIPSPGIEGAKALACELQIPVASMLLPAKDLRQFLGYGGTRVLLDSLERQLVWRQP